MVRTAGKGLFFMDAKSDESRSKTILPNDTLRYALPDADGQRLIKSTTELAGTIEPVVPLAPALDIGSPTGDPDREPDASNELVFDTPANPGKCQFTVSPNAYENFTADGRERVNALCRWQIDAVGEVTPNIALNLNGTTTITYNSMPLNNSAFGRQRLTLTLNGVPAGKWQWYQDVEFFFERDAQSRQAGQPNWFVYWLQVGRAFGFGAPANVPYVWNASEYRPGTTNVVGLFNIIYLPPRASITLFNNCRTSIDQCLETMNHEAGHHASRMLPVEQGGWGTDLIYSASLDSDVDFIPDGFEQTHPDYFTVGVVNDDIQPWDHAPFDPATNRGLTRKFEGVVSDREAEFILQDWARPGKNHGTNIP